MFFSMVSSPKTPHKHNDKICEKVARMNHSLLSYTHTRASTHFFYVAWRDRSVIIIHIMTIKILLFTIVIVIVGQLSIIKLSGQRVQMKNQWFSHKILIIFIRPKLFYLKSENEKYFKLFETDCFIQSVCLLNT